MSSTIVKGLLHLSALNLMSVNVDDFQQVLLALEDNGFATVGGKVDDLLLHILRRMGQSAQISR